jgi:hypothetical protein
MILSFALFIVDAILIGFISLFFLRFFNFSSRLERYILFIILFCAALVFTVYSLSIFKLISAQNILIFHFSVFCLILFISFSQKYKLHLPSISEGSSQSTEIKNHPLIVVLLGFLVVFLVVAFIAGLLVPPNNGDGLSYHLSRVGYWLQNKTLGVYATYDERQICLLPNAEILILWSMAFLKNDVLAFIPQFISYIGIFACVFLFSRFLEFGKVASLFSALLWCSITAVMFEATTVQNDLVVTFFMSAGVYLFLKGLTNKDRSYLFASAIAFGLALGTKGTALFVFPGLIFFGFLIIFHYCDHRARLFFNWLIYVIFSFLLFGSYIYIQNFVTYGSFLGPKALVAKHSTFSPELAYANLIYMGDRFIDTGVFDFLINPDSYLLFHEDVAGFGSIWIFLILPAAIYYLFKTKNFSKWLLLSCGFSFLFFCSFSLIIEDASFRYLIPLTVFVAPLSAIFYQHGFGLATKSKLRFVYLLFFTFLAGAQMMAVAFCNPSKAFYVLPFSQYQSVYKGHGNFFEIDFLNRRFLPYYLPKVDTMEIYQKLDQVSKGNDKVGIISFSDFILDYPAFGASLQRRVFPILYSSFEDAVMQIKNAKLDYLLIHGPRSMFSAIFEDSKDETHLLVVFLEKEYSLRPIVKTQWAYLFDVKNLR